MKGDPNKKGRFCKTELLNAAVKAYPDYEYYVMGDADAYLSDECFGSLREAASRLDSGEASIVFPFDDVLYLNEPDTKRIVAGEELLPGTKITEPRFSDKPDFATSSRSLLGTRSVVSTRLSLTGEPRTTPS